MLITEQERKTIIPSVVIGIGGTGLEIISRLRRLVVESYGSLENLPVLSFLYIDTDREYTVQQTRMAGPPLDDYEKYWAHVTYEEATNIVNNLDYFPWFKEWLPNQLASDPLLLASVEGAKQIRACGRFAFFFNYDRIRAATQAAKERTDFHQDFMLEEYGLTVAPYLNIFVVGSISGGTGSGMLIDLGYSLRRWFGGVRIETTAIIPSPDSFSVVGERSRVKENGYAALMELNYFSDSRTQFSARYDRDDEMLNEIGKQAPYNFIYLIGTSNGARVQLNIDDIREMCAQYIFLDLVSDYSPYKRSLRDNFKGFAAQYDSSPEGQSYPRNFISFGLASIEIPLHHIRNSLGNRLVADLYQWWLNSQVQLPGEPRKEIENELREMRLSKKELIKAILRSGDRQLITIAGNWIGEVSHEIDERKLLQCTAQMPNLLAKETGKILDLVPFIQPKVDEYKSVKFEDNSPDERLHGDFLKIMYDNREQLISQGNSQLTEKIYDYLGDRNRGPKFVEAMLDYLEDIFNSEIHRFEQEADKTWSGTEQAGQQKYDAAIGRISQSASQWMMRKQDKIKSDYDLTLSGLRLAFTARLEYKSRKIAVQVLQELQKTVANLKIRMKRWQQQIAQSAENFRQIAADEVNQAVTTKVVGLNLFEDEREKFNDLYEDLLTCYQGINVINQQMTETILEKSSSLWSKSRDVDATFRLFDLEKLPRITYPKFEKIALETAEEFIKNAPEQSKIKSEIDACIRLMNEYPKEVKRDAQIRLLFEKSKALVVLNRVIPQVSDPPFNYTELALAGVLGGEDTIDSAAKEQVKLLKRYFKKSIAPLSQKERHKIIAVHEVGGFSLRCIEGIKQLRQSYQKWRGRRVKAERAALEGRPKKTEPTVHLQENITEFWDLMPADPKIDELVVITRALGILQREVYQYTSEPVISYYKGIREDREKVVLAASWEDAVQVLELAVCAEDKQEIKRQRDRLIEKAPTQEQKQQLRNQLDSYLQTRMEDFRKQGGETNPRYKREKKIIQEFIEATNLPRLSNQSFSNNSSQSSKPPMGFDLSSTVSTIAENNLKLCSNPECRQPLQPGVHFCGNCGRPVSTQN